MKRLYNHGLNKNGKSGFVLSAPARCAGVLAAAISACYVPTATAQKQDNGLMLEEIVVTVRRRVEMEQDVPISMKAMDSDYLRQQNVVELNDLGTKVSNVRLSNAGTSTNDPIITIRGQRPATAGLELDQAAPLYFNEVVMTPSGGTNLSMYDLQSVQVLKGPQGTLFGRNSTGGAILVTPNRPGVEFGGYAQAEVGDYNASAFEGAVDLPLNDILQFRIAGRMSNHDGYQENVANNSFHGDKLWDENSKSIRVTMNAAVGDLTNLTVASYSYNDMYGRVPVPSAFNPQAQFGAIANPAFNANGELADAIARQNKRDDPFKIETDLRPSDKVQNTFFSNTTEYEINDSLSIKNVFGYRHMTYINTTDADGTALPLFGAVTDSYGIPLANYDVTRKSPETGMEADQYSNEFQFVGDAFDGSLEWISGFYLYQMKGTQYNAANQVVGAIGDASTPVLGGFFGTPFGGILQESPAGDVDNKALGLFGEGTYTFNDKWSLTLGLRYSKDEREVTVKNRAARWVSGGTINYVCALSDKDGNPLPNDACARTESATFEAPTWRTSLNYTPIDGMLVYGSISTGYRAGGINLRGTDNTTLKPFNEETVTTYEIGHKTDWGVAGYAPLQTNLAVFYQDYRDIQKTISSQSFGSGYPSFGTGAVNAASATIQGVEFDATWLVTEDLKVSAGYSYLDAGYNKWITDAGYDCSGCDFSYVPTNTATGSVNYTFPIDPSLGDMSFNVSVYWQDKMNTLVTNGILKQQAADNNWTPENLALAESTVYADSYAIWNVRFDWRNIMETNIDLAVYSKNVTDENYVVGGLNVIDSLGVTAATYGPPRTIGASLRYNF